MALIRGTTIKFVKIGEDPTSSSVPPDGMSIMLMDADRSQFKMTLNPVHVPLSFSRSIGFDDVGGIQWTAEASGFLVEDGFLKDVGADSPTLGDAYKGVLYITYGDGTSLKTISFNACLGSFTAEKAGLEPGRVTATWYNIDSTITFTQAAP